MRCSGAGWLPQTLSIRLLRDQLLVSLFVIIEVDCNGVSGVFT